MLLDIGKCGSLREISLTDIRDVLLFMVEYPALKGVGAAPRKVYVDDVDWL